MYKAKARSKGGIQVFDSDMHVRAARRWNLQNELRRAVADGQLELRYQPIVRLDSGRISGAESLVRWRRSRDELVCPAEFIPIAEEVGLIADVGGWALEEACRQNKEWQDAGWRSVKISVNISVRQLSRPEFLRTVRKILVETELNPRLAAAGNHPKRPDRDPGCNPGKLGWIVPAGNSAGARRLWRRLLISLVCADFRSGP